jgi:hypothetical protein
MKRVDRDRSECHECSRQVVATAQRCRWRPARLGCTDGYAMSLVTVIRRIGHD